MRNTRMGIGLIVLLTCSLSSFAQSPNPAAHGAGQDNAGFYRGWTLGTSFEGSTSGDGSVYDLGTSAGYNFTHHFGLDLSVRTFSLALPLPSRQKTPEPFQGTALATLART